MLKLYNSLTRKKEKFIPISSNKVTMYVCGITPYDTTHLGHAFTYISFDVLIRYLTYCGYKVTYTQNVTDINDRDKDILQRAKEQNILWNKLADFWTKKFLIDMKNLNWAYPTYYLKASEQIPAVISLIKKLLKNGFAYQVNGSVYLDISKYPDYGKLSKFNQTKMIKVSKNFEEDLDCPEKKNALDITLWRTSTSNQASHIPSFPSPFGNGRPAQGRGSPSGGGRPGWHIECSAMSMEMLGEQIDIHGGGIDLMFPHHEAEIAQSEGATGKIPFAKYWVHTGGVSYHGAKMSKSLGNMIMVSDLLKKYTQNSIRWALISHHHRENWEFFKNDLQEAEKSLSIVSKALRVSSQSSIEGKIKADGYIKKFENYMNNDLNTPKTLALLLRISQVILKNSSNNNLVLQELLKKMLVTLGFILPI